MGNSSNVQRRRARGDAARERAAAARAASRARERRRRLLIVVAASVGVVAVVGGIVLAAVLRGSSTTSSAGAPRTPAPASVVRDVTGVPGTVLDSIGLGTAVSVPKAVSEPPVSAGGHPEVLYVGAEYCPFCAAERWSLVQALSRFGTWHDLSLTRSAANDVHPNTPTFTFHGATYSSRYLSFVGKELYTNQPQGNGYRPLDTLTPDEQRLFDSHTNGFPFTDLGGRYVTTGVGYDPAVLSGLTAAQIATAMHDRQSPVARGIDGSANAFTAALCTVTGGRPANVCTAPGVQAAAAKLGG